MQEDPVILLTFSPLGYMGMNLELVAFLIPLFLTLFKFLSVLIKYEPTAMLLIT